MANDCLRQLQLSDAAMCSGHKGVSLNSKLHWKWNLYHEISKNSNLQFLFLHWYSVYIVYGDKDICQLVICTLHLSSFLYSSIFSSPPHVFPLSLRLCHPFPSFLPLSSTFLSYHLPPFLLPSSLFSLSPSIPVILSVSRRLLTCVASRSNWSDWFKCSKCSQAH